MHLDVLASLLLAACCIAMLAAHVWVGRKKRYRRVAQQGATFVLGEGMMNAGYWLLQPIVRRCVAAEISASGLTWCSLLPAGLAAIAAGCGHWGLAAWALLASAILDVLDGAVARATGEMSPAGAVLDSVLDRYAEFIFFAGVLMYYRDHWLAQLVTLTALCGSFLITYSTAKAEALHVTPPRGPMKRSDRLTALIVGSALVPLVDTFYRPHPLAWPFLASVVLIAVLANMSAVHRFYALYVSAGALKPSVAAAPRKKPAPDLRPVAPADPARG